MTSPRTDPPEIKDDSVPLIHATRGDGENLFYDNVYVDLRGTPAGVIVDSIAQQLERERFYTGLATALAITGWLAAFLIWIF